MHYSQAYEENKNAIVERFNRTLAQLLQNWRTATKQYDWYRVLPDIVNNYNNSFHSTIKSTPQKVFDGKQFNTQQVFYIVLMLIENHIGGCNRTFEVFLYQTCIYNK